MTPEIIVRALSTRMSLITCKSLSTRKPRP